MRNRLLGDSLEKVEPPSLCGAPAGVPFIRPTSFTFIEILDRWWAPAAERHNSAQGVSLLTFNPFPAVLADMNSSERVNFLAVLQ